MHFYDSKQASNFIKVVLKQRHNIIVQEVHKPTQRSLHMELLEKLPDNTIKTHHVKFSREHYHQFGNRFPQWYGQQGESINKDIVVGLPDNALFYFVFPESIWTITKHKIMNECGCEWIPKHKTPVLSVPLSELTEFYNQTGDNSDFFLEPDGMC